nr:MAG TPA: hypothetical protein [Caudoviricetes sp.]
MVAECVNVCHGKFLAFMCFFFGAPPFVMYIYHSKGT